MISTQTLIIVSQLRPGKEINLESVLVGALANEMSQRPQRDVISQGRYNDTELSREILVISHLKLFVRARITTEASICPRPSTFEYLE